MKLSHAFITTLYSYPKTKKVVIFRDNDTISLSDTTNNIDPDTILAILPSITESPLGSASFMSDYDIKFPLYIGAMAGGISSEDLVINASKHGYLASFGAAGLSLARIKKAIETCQKSPDRHRIAFNLIHQPENLENEMDLVKLYKTSSISIIEASAFMQQTPALCYFKAVGLTKKDNAIHSTNRIIAKISHPTIAEKFLSPPSDTHLAQLVSQGLITAEQRDLASNVPLADDITVEADSGGHTDRRSLINILPIIIKLRNNMSDQLKTHAYPRVGAAGGISTPQSIVAAFRLGADYVVTGSINQCTREAGTSDRVKKLLASASINNIAMAPSADMFEMGVMVQVYKGRTLFASRAQRLFDLYMKYPSVDAIPNDILQKLEKQFFKMPLADVWKETKEYLRIHNEKKISIAENNPKKKMALMFRYYLGLSSKWAIQGDMSHENDFQIWCGQAMGAFNDWVKGTKLEHSEERHIGLISDTLVHHTYHFHRLDQLRSIGISIPDHYFECTPHEHLPTQTETIKESQGR